MGLGLALRSGLFPFNNANVQPSGGGHMKGHKNGAALRKTSFTGNISGSLAWEDGLSYQRPSLSQFWGGSPVRFQRGNDIPRTSCGLSSMRKSGGALLDAIRRQWPPDASGKYWGGRETMLA